MFGITDFSFDFLTGYPYITGLIFVLFLLIAIRLYRRTNPPLPRGIRILLGTLRIIAVMALFLALFEPVVSYNRVYEKTPSLTVLVDRSASMNIEESGSTRGEQAERFLDSAPFSGIASAFDVNIIPFSARLRADGSIGDTNKTALGQALDELSKRQIGEPSSAWIVLSDGISNHGISPVEIAPGIKSPVYTLGIGEEQPDKDVALSGLDYNNIMFAGRPTEITARLEWSGLDGENARISIKSGNRNFKTETVKLGEGNLRDEITLKFTPEKPGQQTFEVAVSGIDGEITEANNSRSFSVSVLKSKLQVLLVSEHLDWEFSFMKRFLDNSESVELTPVVFKEGGGFLTGSFPARQTEINQYDLIILYDVDWTKLRNRAELFDSFLEDKGGGLFVLMADNYLRNRFPRWIDQYLPFVVTRTQANPLYHQFNGIPIENYLFHPAVRIGDNRRDIRAAWGDLPHFETLLPIDSITDGAEILVVSDIGEGDNAVPVLGFRRFGPGKVLAAAAGPFWQWAFLGYGFDQEPDEYRLFMNGVVNWLALKEESDPVRVYPDKDIYTRGEAVGFNASVYDLGFRPITGASGHISLSRENDPDSTVVQFIETGDGRYRAEFEVLPPGRYAWRGLVEKDGKTLKEADGQIAVEAYTVEEFRRRPDFAALAAVSQLTGGDFAPIDRADSILAKLDTNPVIVTETKEISLWNKLWLLMIFITVLGVEWFLRKRYQLI